MKKPLIQNLKLALAFFAVIFMIGLVLQFKNLNTQAVAWTAVFALAITLVLMFLVWLYQFIYCKVNRISLSDFDINSTQTSSFIIGKSIDETKHLLNTIIPDKINSNEFIYDQAEDVYKTKTGATHHSWGENILVKLTEIDSFKTQLLVLSKSVYKFNLIDFGKSYMNIKRIKLAFNQND